MIEAESTLKPLGPEEAIQYFRDKVVIPSREFYRLYLTAKANAFSVAEIASLDVLNDIHEELVKALEYGLPGREFRKNVNEKLVRRGWKKDQLLSPYRCDTIYRTNIQTAYQVGRYKKMTDPAVIKSRPYWIYSAIRDSRTRPTHMAMHGVCRRYDDPFWDKWYPPNGYRCRCSVRSVSQREVDQNNITVTTGPTLEWVEPPGRPAQPLIPDLGFDYNPGKEAYQPDLSKYPESLRKAYEERQNRKKKEE